MKAAVCYEFGKPLVVEDVELAPTGAGQVRVRVAATAVCHSDIHDIKGEMPGRVPFVGGHETAGHVEEVGPGVSAVRPGDPVVVSLLASCGECYYCTSGMPHLCEIKFAPPAEVRLRNGKGQPLDQKAGVAGFAEHVLVGESQVVKVPGDMPLDRAALLACGVMTGFGGVVNRAQVRPFQSVAVMGVGGVGINAIQGAAFVGAYPIIAMDLLDAKMKQAMDFGATHTVNAGRRDAVAAVRQLTGGRGPDFVFVTVGSIAAIRQGLAMTASRGTTVVIGLPPASEQLCFSPLELIPTEKNLIGGFMGAANLRRDIPRLVALYRAGRLKLDELVSGRYPLERINEAISSTERGDALRNVIIFG
jgi:S-(hydroxymethyl)glutathione dehydrogenase / alcohol dehydrogenase